MSKLVILYPLSQRTSHSVIELGSRINTVNEAFHFYQRAVYKSSIGIYIKKSSIFTPWKI